MVAVEDVVYVVDENLQRLGKGMSTIRRDTARFTAQPLDDLLPEGIEDPERIPIVGDNGWVLITNDRRIRTRPIESRIALRHKLKVVHLHGAVGNARPWDQLVRLATRWDAIAAHVDSTPDGPWWLSVQQSRMRVMRFEPGIVER